MFDWLRERLRHSQVNKQLHQPAQQMVSALENMGYAVKISETDHRPLGEQLDHFSAGRSKTLFSHHMVKDYYGNPQSQAFHVQLQKRRMLNNELLNAKLKSDIINPPNLSSKYHFQNSALDRQRREMDSRGRYIDLSIAAHNTGKLQTIGFWDSHHVEASGDWAEKERQRNKIAHTKEIMDGLQARRGDWRIRAGFGNSLNFYERNKHLITDPLRERLELKSNFLNPQPSTKYNLGGFQLKSRFLEGFKQ